MAEMSLYLRHVDVGAVLQPGDVRPRLTVSGTVQRHVVALESLGVGRPRHELRRRLLVGLLCGESGVTRQRGGRGNNRAGDGYWECHDTRQSADVSVTGPSQTRQRYVFLASISITGSFFIHADDQSVCVLFSHSVEYGDQRLARDERDLSPASLANRLST